MKFGTNFEEGAVLMYGEYTFSDMPAIEMISEDGEDIITEVIPGIYREKDEITLNHDILPYTDLVDSVIDYIGVSKREVVFGPFDTKTYVVKLKKNWQDLCMPF